MATLDWEKINEADTSFIGNDEETAEQFFEMLSNGHIEANDTEADNRELMIKLFYVAKAVLSVKGLQYEAAIEEMEKIAEEATGEKEKEMVEEITHLQSELEQYRKYTGTGDKYFRTEILQLEERNKMMQKELDELERRLLREQNSYDRVNSDMQSLESRYKDTKRELDKALSDINEYQRQFQSQRESIIMRRSNVEDVRDELSKKNRELSEYLDEIKQLQQANDVLQGEVENAKKELEQATHDMNKMADDYSKLKIVLEDTDCVVEDMRRERDILRSQVQDMQEQLQSKAAGDDQVMIALNQKVSEWKDILSSKDMEISTKNREIVELEKQLQAARMDSDRNTLVDLMEANTKKDEQIKDLKHKLELATKDYDDVTDHINSLKSKTKDGTPSLYQQRKIQTLNKTIQHEQMNTNRERERVIEIEQDIVDKDKQITELVNRLIQYEQGQYGLPEAVQEIKDCRAQIRIRDKNIEELTKEINQIHMELNDLNLENEEMRDRLGIGSREELDTNAIRKKKAVKEEQAQALNRVLQREVERLEEERVQLKKAVRNQALDRGQRAVEMGLSSIDMEPVDNEFIISQSKSKVIKQPESIKHEIEIENKVDEKTAENMIVRMKTLEDENKEVKQENYHLEIGLREIHGALKTGTDLSKNLEVPALDKLIAIIEQRYATGQYDTTVQLKAQIHYLTGRNEEIRTELRNAQFELSKNQNELIKDKQNIEGLLKEIESLRELSEGVIKLNPLPLPEGIVPTSKDIIACLNEYLIQILQELSNKEDLCMQMEKALEECRRNYSVTIHQQGILYKEYIDLKEENGKEKEKLIVEKEDALLSKSQDQVRIQEYEKLLENLQTSPENFKKLLAELSRRVTVLRVNEKSLTRRYTIMQDVEKNVRKENSKLRKEALDIHAAVTRKVGDLERHKEISIYKITTLQKSLEDSVPGSELELANRQYNELTAKYRDLLQRENALISRSSVLETLQADLQACQHTENTLKEKLLVEKERSHALEQTLNELLLKLGRDADGSVYQTSEITSISRKLATLEMKELNEREKANHATIKYEQLRMLVTELENRNAELEQKFSEIAKLNLESQRIERELREELINSVPANINKADKYLIQKLEEKKGLLENECSRQKEMSEIAQHQAEVVMLQQQSQDKEMTSLRKRFYELQMETDEKAIIAKLHQQIVALQVSEATAVRKYKVSSSTNSRLEGHIMKQQKLIDEKNEALNHLRSENRSKTRFLKKVVQDLRCQFSGALPLSQQERFSGTSRILQEKKLEMEAALHETKIKCLTAEDYSMELKLRNDGLQELISTLKDGQGAKKVAEWHERMSEIRLQDMKLKRQVEQQKEQLLYQERLNTKQAETISILEESNIKQAKDYEDRQLLWEQHEVELERTIGRLEKQQEELIEAARRFEEATGSMPDESLPIANQLDLAIGKIKEHIKTIIVTRAEINKSKEAVDVANEKFRKAESSLVHKEKIINELRLRLPLTQRDIPLTAEDSTNTQLTQKGTSYEAQQALQVAQATVESLKLLLQKKDENLTKYQNMLNKSREELKSQAESHHQEIKVLQGRLQLEIKEHIRKIKKIHHEYVNAPQAAHPTVKQLQQLAELEELVAEQDNALGTASQKYHRGQHEITSLKLEAEENIKYLQQQLKDLKEQYHAEVKSLKLKVDENSTIIKEKLIEIEVLNQELELAKEKAPSRTLKSLVERLRNQLAKKDKEQKALSQALLQIRSDMVNAAEENVQAYSKKVEDEISVQKLIEKHTSELSSRVEELQMRMERMKKELKQKKENEAAISTDAEELRKDVERKDNALKEMAVELKKREEYQENYKKLQAENKNLMSKLHDISREDLSRETVQQTPQADSEEKQGKEAKTKEEVIRWDESKKWQKKVETMRMKLKEKCDECSQLERTNNLLREGIARHEKDKLAMQNRVKSLSKGSTSIDHPEMSLQHEDIVAGLKQRIFSLEDENNDLSRQLALDRDKEIQELRIQNSQLNETLHTLEAQLAKQQLENDPDGYMWSIHREQQLQKEMLEIRKENMELRFENEQAKNDNPRLKGRVKDLQEYVDILKSEMESIKKKEKQKKTAMGTGMAGQSVEDMERVIFAMRRVVERLQTENESLKKRSSKPKPQADLLKENRNLKQEVQRLKQLQAPDKQRLSSAPASSTTKLLQENEKLRKDLKRLVDDNEKLCIEAGTLRVTNEKLVQDVGEKKQSLKDANEKLANTNVNTEPKSKSAVVTKLFENRIKTLEQEVQKKNNILKDIKVHLRSAAEREAELLKKVDDLEEKVYVLQDFPPGIHTENEAAKHLQQSRLTLKRLEEEKHELIYELERLRNVTSNGENPIDLNDDEILLKLRKYDKLLAVEVDLRTKMKTMDIEREKLISENKKLKKELLAFDPAFFEELEDLKYNYKKSIERNILYEQQLRQLSSQFGVNVNIPVDEDDVRGAS